MPNQYRGYCYETQAEAVNADIGYGPIPGSAGIASPNSYVVVNSTTVNMTYKFKGYSTANEANYVHARVYPLCTTVGQLDNNSGISVTDALEVSWLVVSVWISAYLFKSLRTAARGY